MKLNYKKMMNNYWGPTALGMFVLLWAMVSFCKSVLGLSLRSVPQVIFTWLGVGVIIAFFVWIDLRIHRTDKQKKPIWIKKAICYVLPVSITCCTLILIMIAFLISTVSYRPEHVVEKHGYRMVARVHSFLDEYVHYYQDKGALFYGQEMGYEYYGSGGGDPLTEDPIPEPIQWAFYDMNGNVIESNVWSVTEGTEEPQPQTEIKRLDIAVIENRENELVFDISIDDYIDSYNGYYWNDKNSCYLSPPSEWRCSTYETAIHSDHETFYYNFTEDEKIWPLPTISVYVPTNGNYIQEITLNFDDHSYTEAMYDLYEEMCFYTLKVFFPDFTDEKITELYTSLNKLAYGNVFPNEEGYGSDSVPCALFYKDGIGLYPYFAIGEFVHLCIIPVTQETIDEFEMKGVEIYEIQ